MIYFKIKIILKNILIIVDIDQDYFEEREYPEEHKIRILNKVRELRKKTENNDNENLNKNEKHEFSSDTLKSGFYFNEAAIESDMNLLPANKEKRCCWNCLKVLLKENSIDKNFQEKIIKLKVVNIIQLYFFFDLFRQIIDLINKI